MEEKPGKILARLRRKKLRSPVEDDLVCTAAYKAFKELMKSVLTLGWDGYGPGHSGAVFISELAGVYMVTSSDYDPLGPFDSIDEALKCEYFDVAAPNPELDSKVLPLTQLLAVARRVVDWENEGEIWINSQKYVVKGTELIKERKK